MESRSSARFRSGVVPDGGAAAKGKPSISGVYFVCVNPDNEFGMKSERREYEDGAAVIDIQQHPALHVLRSVAAVGYHYVFVAFVARLFAIKEDLCDANVDFCIHCK